jgi:hypothetical protein
MITGGKLFDYGYDEVARIVGKTEDNARQGTRIAGAHLREVDINGQPGALLLDRGSYLQPPSFAMSGFATRRPDAVWKA